MADFIREDLTGSRFEDVDLRDARFRDVDPTNSRFHVVDLSGARIRGALVVDDEWSFVETLRHLAFARDAWVNRAILGVAPPVRRARPRRAPDPSVVRWRQAVDGRVRATERNRRRTRIWCTPVPITAAR
jgi:hypothetical protein